MAKSLYLSLLAVGLTAFMPISTLAADITCMTTSTSLEGLITCFEAFTVPDNFYTAATYTTAQPTAAQKTSWAAGVNTLLSSTNAAGTGCSTTPVDVAGLSGIFQIGKFTESAANGGKSWCVLFEKQNMVATPASGGAAVTVYRKGWGLVVTPAKTADVVHGRVHYSVPHPTSDSDTPVQGAALVKRTGAKSLVITGRHRRAYAVETTCSKGPSGDINYRTDGAHDKDEPFFLAMKRIMEWQNANGGCPLATCGYLQLHGKQSTTCSTYNVFLSSGRGNSASSETCYNNSLLPIRRLEAELDSTFSAPFSVGIPAAAETCSLTATRNIFARLSQGVAEANICDEGVVIPCASMGPFVHIEQDAATRGSAKWASWASAINDTF